jgi:aryl-alcohol dehydrogenase-like predicted oxidoreductase
VERRPLGRTGLEVPVVGLGTYKVFNVSGDAAEARCGAVVDAALESGCALFDSSPMYGAAERVLAGALADRREEAIVATKVWSRTRAQGEEQIEQALDWFEHVDLYQVHNLLALDDHLPYLRHLQQGGRVRAVGVTHYLPSALPDMVEMIKRREVDTVQVPYHPLERSIEAQLLPEAHACGVGVIIMMPFGSGRLLENPPTDEELAPLQPFGVHTWAQALLKWILSDPRIACAIPATSSPERMAENAAAGAPPWFGGDQRTYVRQLAQSRNSR